MANPLIPGTGTTLYGQVRNPATEANQDGTFVPLSVDRQGGTRVSDLHGRWYTAAVRGNLFVASTLIAGVTLPAPATTLASKAGMRNPLGSGVNVELVALGLTSVTIDVALKNFLMEFQINASTTGGVPTSITDLTSYAMPLGSARTSVAKAYSAATMTNAAANPILIPFYQKLETAVGGVPVYCPFNGEIVFGPDTVMAITCTAALAAVNVTYIWAEWPV